jgi:hypothetical protein
MVPPQDQSVLGPVAAHVADVWKLFGIFLGLAASPVLLDWLANMGPPWPHRSGVAYFTVIVLLIVIIVTYSNWQNVALSRQQARINQLAVVTVITLVLFAFFFSFFVANAPDAAHQIAKGFTLTPEWQKILTEGKFPDGKPFPINGIESLLKANAWKAENIYPAWQVYTVNLILLLSWLGFYASVASLASLFVLRERKKADNARKARVKASTQKSSSAP